MLAYDDLYAIEYFQRKERAWWRRNGADAARHAARRAPRSRFAAATAAQRFDNELMADLRKRRRREVCPPRRARLSPDAGRAQARGRCRRHGHVLPQGEFQQRLHRHRRRDLSQRAVHPALQSALLKAQLQPVLDYARMDRWRWPFAPHDLGTYPQANGQVYGGGERTEENQMPVEESGNMLIMLAALARVEGNAASPSATGRSSPSGPST